jgi:dissimilatory sulfite reductase (desulfoviridin) alpha/beta subunit
MTDDEKFDNPELIIDFNEEELEKAQVPIYLGDVEDNPESTHPLFEAPFPSGATLGPRNILEPILTIPNDEDVDKETSSDVPARVLPPNFILRLGMESGTAGKSNIEEITENSWLLSSGDQWPVFVYRFYPPRPIQSKVLKAFAMAALRYGDNRVCLGHDGHFDVFFNDRSSLENFTAELEEIIPPKPSQCPVRIEACSGMLTCPLAAVDTLNVAEKLNEILTQHTWKEYHNSRPKISLSIAGCQVGQGKNCGLNEFADIKLTAHRNAYPEINQDIVALSPNISRLISNCPCQAIYRSRQSRIALEINHRSCSRCGWCVNEDSAINWPVEQNYYFSMVTSSHNQFSSAKYIRPTIIWPLFSIDILGIAIIITKKIDI